MRAVIKKLFLVKFLTCFNDRIIELPQQCANTLRHGQSNRRRLTMDSLSFNAEKYYLGKLCIRNHDNLEAGKSLRSIATKQCLECGRISAKNYRFNHPEQANESVQKYRKRNPELAIKLSESYRVSGKSAQNTKQWRQRHPEYRQIHAENERLRRFKVRASRLVDYKIEQVKARFAEFNNCCAYCRLEKKLTIDHFIAIAKGGPDCLGNIVPACFNCNSSKKSSDPMQWYQKQKFYSQKQWDFILFVLGKSDYRQIPLF